MVAIRSGAGILFTVTIMYQYFELITKENEKGADTFLTEINMHKRKILHSIQRSHYKLKNDKSQLIH